MRLLIQFRNLKTLVFYISLALGFFLLINVCPTMYWGTPIFKDRGDIPVYIKRTIWVDNGGLPYRDVFQEYPQVAALFIAIPKFMSRITKFDNFEFWFYLLMLLVFIAFMVTAHLFWPFQKSKLFLMFLPATLFYSFSRFDLLPTLLLLLSLTFLLKKEKFGLSAVLFVLSVFTKWYIVVTLLPILAFIETRYNTIKALSYLGIIFLIGSIMAGSSVIVFGWNGFWATYQYHLSRGCNYESLFYLLYLLSNRLFQGGNLVWVIFSDTFFSLLQFSSALLLIWIKPKTDKQLIAFCGFSVAIFILFAKFHSPQWVIWLLPFVYLIGDWKIMAAYFMFDLATYYHIPITYNLFGVDSLKALWASGVKFIFLIILIYLFIKGLHMEGNKKLLYDVDSQSLGMPSE